MGKLLVMRISAFIVVLAIKVNRKKIKIVEPQKQGNYPWVQGWVKQIKLILRKALIEGKEQFEIPSVAEYVKKIKEEKLEQVPQLSEEEKQKLNELNEKIQDFLHSSKIRYWIKDKKIEKVTKELRKLLS